MFSISLRELLENTVAMIKEVSSRDYVHEELKNAIYGSDNSLILRCINWRIITKFHIQVFVF